MKDLMMMKLRGCPYCSMAEKYIKELIEENPAYGDIVIDRKDEQQDKELSDSLDYYYCPAFYLDGRKLFEGVPTKDIVRDVLEAALRA